MTSEKLAKGIVGRIAERIVANELEAQGFTVRDLNLEGVAANADLLAVRNEKVWLIQVKGTRYNEQYANNGWWFQYGYCTQEHIADRSVKMFNRVPGSFQANIVVLVCFRSAYEYQLIYLPVEKAEQFAQENLDFAFRGPRVNAVAGKDSAPLKPGIVWLTLFRTKARTESRQEGIDKEQENIRPYLVDRSWKIDRALESVRAEVAGGQKKEEKIIREVFENI